MTFKHSKKWYFYAKLIAWMVGALCCALPPLIAAVDNFPVMVTTDTNSTISIFFVIGVLIACSCVMRSVVKAFKENALLSVCVVLAAITAVLVCGYYMKKETILGLAWVAGSGAVGVLVGMIFFKLHDLWDDLYKHCGEVYVK